MLLNTLLSMLETGITILYNRIKLNFDSFIIFLKFIGYLFAMLINSYSSNCNVGGWWTICFFNKSNSYLSLGISYLAYSLWDGAW